MYINGVEISGISTKPIELTQAEYDALPEEKKQNGCYIITDGESEPFTAENVSYDNTDSGLVATDVQAAIDELAEGGGGGGGHTIVNDSGTSMTQRSDLQFNGVYTSDNSTDDTTEVNIIREMTELEYSQLTAAEKKGIIVTDASTPSVIGLTGDMVMYDSTSTVNDKLDDYKEITTFNVHQNLDSSAVKVYEYLNFIIVSFLNTGVSGTITPFSEMVTGLPSSKLWMSSSIYYYLSTNNTSPITIYIGDESGYNKNIIRNCSEIPGTSGGLIAGSLIYIKA